MHKNKSMFIKRITAFALSAVLLATSAPAEVYADQNEDIESYEEINVIDDDASDIIKEDIPDILKDSNNDSVENDDSSEYVSVDIQEDNFVEDEEDEEDEEKIVSFEIFTEDGEEADFYTGYHSAPGEDDFESYGLTLGDEGIEEYVSIPASYKPSYSSLPSLRNQNPYGSCWAHSAMALAEIGQENRTSVDYSELHLAYFSYNGYRNDPLGGITSDYNSSENSDFLENGGSIDTAANVLMAWTGFADESTAPYSNASTVLTNGLSSSIAMSDVLHLKNYYKTNINNDRDGAKALILKYGAVSTSFYALNPGYYMTYETSTGSSGQLYHKDVYNSANNCYYFPVGGCGTNHAVTIVGWDDDFSKYNFSKTPSGNGAWLIRNSWTTGIKEAYEGYFWMSYYDASLDGAFAFETEAADKYDNNYQYDGSMTGPSYYYLLDYCANVFTAKACDAGEYIDAVAFYTNGANSPYTVSVYTGITTGRPESGTLMAKTSGTTTYAGYHTIELPESVFVNKGDMFSVVVQCDGNIFMEGTYEVGGSGYKCRASISSGQSYYKSGSSWIDFKGTRFQTERQSGNFRIKAFTRNADRTIQEPCTVSFDSQGGTECSPKEVKKGQTYGSLPTPTRTGYKFDAWYDEHGVKITSSSIVKDSSDHTLYASWLPNTYTLYFNANGGSVSETSRAVVYDGKYGGSTQVLPVPIRTGYDFDGWYTASSGGNKVLGTDTVKITSSTTLYAHWTAKKYTVTFNPNGGSVSESSRIVTYGAKYGGDTKTLPTPIKSGYSFDGWYTSLSGGSLITADSTVSITADKTIYAHWTGNTITVTYDANGGSVTAANKPVTVGKTYGTLTTPTRNGYNFDGWYTSKVSGTKIESTTTVTETSNHTIYAHWSGKQYKVTFNANGGSVAETYRYVINGSDYSAGKGDFPKPTRAGYDFIGWYTQKEGGIKKVYTDTFDNASDQILYAQWNPKSYTVTFNPNGGNVSEASRQVKYGSAYGGETGKLPVPTKSGYEFDGWYTAIDSGSKIEADSTYNLTDDTTLYAHWLGAQITVTYDANGGKVGINSKSVRVGTAYGELAIPNRTGYRFDGWYSGKTDGSLIDSNTIVSAGSSHTIYAHWDPEQYKVIFDANGGSVSESSRTVAYESTYGEVAGPLPVPSRLGYDFAGWFTRLSGGEKVLSTDIYSLTDNQTLYAQWDAKSYTVTFDANGGSVSESSRSVTYDLTYDAVYGELPTAIKVGYNFVGWYTEAEGGDKVTGSSTVKITTNSKLYAHYENATFVITFDAGEGSVFPADKKVKYLDAFGTLPIASRPGYDFDGWYLDEDKNTLASEDTIYSITENITLYAGWREIEAPAELWLDGVLDSVKYTGSAITFDNISVYNHKTLLTEGVDYTVKYSNNVKACDSTAKNAPKVTITGKGNFSGTIVKTFTIEALSLGDAVINDGFTEGSNAEEVSAPDISLVYTGRVILGTTQVMYTMENGTTIVLKKGTDYTLTYPNTDKRLAGYSQDAFCKKGDYYVLITGKGNYSGTAVFKETIVRTTSSNTPLSTLKLEKIADKYATGEGVILSGEDIKIKGGKTLALYNAETEIGDYTAEYMNNILPGTATVVLTGKGKYSGSIVLTYKIKALPFNKVKAEYSIQPKTYTGFNVEMDKLAGDYCNLKYYESSRSLGDELTEGVDYVITYSNNVNPGKTANIIFTGIGKYTGSIKKSFTILPKNISEGVDKVINDMPVYMSPVEVRYTDGGAKLKIALSYNGIQLTEGKDYTVTYSGNKNISVGDGTLSGVATAVIKGKGKFCGEMTERFNVISGDYGSISVSDIIYKEKTGLCKPVVAVYDLNGKKLNAGRDYGNIYYKYNSDTEVIYKPDSRLPGNEVLRHMGEAVDKYDIVPAGTVIQCVIEGKGNYINPINNTKQFTYSLYDISKVAVKVLDRIYDGTEQKPDKSEIIITARINGITTFIDESSYEIVEGSYVNNINKGTAKFTIHGIGDFCGYKTVSFKILNKNMNYTIYYYSNNSAATGTMRPSVISSGGQLAKNSYVLAGKTFDYWSTSPEYNTVEDDLAMGIVHYPDKAAYYGDTSFIKRLIYGSNVNLYAHWK